MKQSIISNSLRGTIFFLFFVLCSTADAGTDYYCDFSVNGIYYQYVSGTTDEVAVSYDNYETGRYGGNYTNYSGYVSVPSTVTYNGKTYKVTAVSNHAFQECSVTTVNLPSTIKSIGYAAFLDCYQLTSVNLPSSITTIGDNAFNGCTVLGNVTLPTALKSIGNSAFQNCKTFTNISIPDGVTTIGASAFQSCNNLASISIPSSVVSVGSSAFSGTAWYTNLPNGMVYFGSIAYCYKGTMPENTTIEIKGETTSIAGGAFTNCVNLVSVSIPSSVTSIGNNAFYYCSGLKSVDIPNTVKKIENYTFAGCTSLSSVNIPNGVISIGDYAFQGCSSLKTLTIPNSITSIGNCAFNSCSGLTSVTIGSGVSEFGDYAFYGCTNLSSLEIKDGATSIGNCTFQSCSSLSTINLPNSLISIGSNAFSGCAWIANLPDGVVYAGKVAYCYKGTMSDYTNITLKEGTLGIASYAFSSCSLLSSVTLPSSLKNIGPSAFNNCSNLTSVTALMEVPVPIDNSMFSYRNFATLHVPTDCKAAYEAADYWKDFKEIVEIQPEQTDKETLSVEDVKARSGSTVETAINLTNESEDLTAFQFDLILPDGISLGVNDKGKYVVSKTSRYEDDSQTLNVSKLEGSENTYRFVCFSMSNEVITGTSGAILNAALTVGESVNEDSYEATITNIVVTKTDGTQLKLNDAKFNIVVSNVIPGDANGDGEVNVTDIVEIVNYIMEKPSDKFVAAAADLNGDGEINVTDIVKVVTIIMDTNSSSASMHRSAMSSNLTLSGKGLVKTAIVQHAEQFTAAQFDIILDDGQEVDNIRLNSNSDHSLIWKMTKEGICRVVVYSLTNSVFDGNDSELMSISLKGMNGRIAVENVILVTANSNTTGIGMMTTDKSVESWYTLDGRKLDSKPTKKGIYIKNGKKFVVR